MDMEQIKDVYNPTYDEIHAACGSFVEHTKWVGATFDGIIAVATGGIVPATIIAKRLNLPIEIVYYSSVSGVGERKYTNDLQKTAFTNPLIVDDISDTGNTLKELADWYCHHTNTVTVFSVYYKTSSCYRPIYYVEIPDDGEFVNFPWELE